MKSRFVDTPLGIMKFSETQGRICRAEFIREEQLLQDDESALLDEAAHQIHAYFSGKLQRFTLPVAPGGTAFEQEVLRALMAIAYGETASYAEIARLIGRPHAARAVGRACARNPVLVIIPCHRVVASDGKLAGFAAGVDRKKSLLYLERQFKT